MKGKSNWQSFISRKLCFPQEEIGNFPAGAGLRAKVENSYQLPCKSWTPMLSWKISINFDNFSTFEWRHGQVWKFPKEKMIEKVLDFGSEVGPCSSLGVSHVQVSGLRLCSTKTSKLNISPVSFTLEYNIFWGSGGNFGTFQYFDISLTLCHSIE